MNDIVVTVVAGCVLFLLTSFVSLAVWAINAKINAAAAAAKAQQEKAELQQENEHLMLEARIAKDLVAPAVEELRTLVRHLEEQLHVREIVINGFDGVHSALAERIPIAKDAERRPGSRT